MGGMHDRAIRGVAERVADRRNICSTPLAYTEPLGNLLRDEVSEDREFAGEIVIDADNFFGQVRRRVVSSDEYWACRPFSSALAAGKMPAVSKEVALGEIMQEGMVLFGKGAP